MSRSFLPLYGPESVYPEADSSLLRLVQMSSFREAFHDLPFYSNFHSHEPLSNTKTLSFFLALINLQNHLSIIIIYQLSVFPTRI